MNIGILSDTHGYFHPSLVSDFEGVDLILHAGDVGSEDILVGLEAIAPVRGVFGNIDGFEIRSILPEHNRFEEEGVTFWMTHIAGRPGRWQRGMESRLKEEAPSVFICGHSHILQIERVSSLDEMLFVNPGAAGRQGLHTIKTCVRLSISNGNVDQAEVIHLDE